MTGPVTIRLHGYPVSNWFNCVRTAMLEKNLAGAFVSCRASADAAFLAQSAMGKIPWLETERGGIAETVAILEYLEDIVPGPALYPVDRFERAKVRQIVNVAQVYIEASLRALYPSVFMGGEAGAGVADAALASVRRAMAAIDLLCTFRPFVRGSDLSAADIVLFFTLELGERTTRHVAGWSFFEGRPQLAAWDAMLRERPSIQAVLADFTTAFAEYCQAHNAAWNEAAYQERRFSHA